MKKEKSPVNEKSFFTTLMFSKSKPRIEIIENFQAIHCLSITIFTTFAVIFRQHSPNQKYYQPEDYFRKSKVFLEKFDQFVKSYLFLLKVTLCQNI